MKQPLNNNSPLGSLPIGRLFVKMSVPMMFSMLVQGLYGIVDSIFVARLGEDALAAITLAAPIQILMISIGLGLSIGVNVVLSGALGENRPDRAARSAGNGILMEWGLYVLFAVAGLLLVGPYYRMQTDVVRIQTLGTAYASVVMLFSLGLVNQIIMERLLISTGRTWGSMVSLLSGAVINTILDPLLILGFGSFEGWGIQGAAIATVIAQTIAATIGLILNLRFNHELALSPTAFRPDPAMMKRILRIGVPAMFSLSVDGLLLLGMTRILGGFAVTVTALYGVYNRLQGMAMMPIRGLRNTIVSVIAYNVSAGNRSRVQAGIRISTLTALAIMLTGTGVFWVFPGAMLTWFHASDRMMEIGIPAFRILSLTFGLSGISLIFGAIFQGFGRSDWELMLSLTRFTFILGGAALLARQGEINRVWWSFPIAEFVVGLLAALLMIRIRNTAMRQMGAEAVPDWVIRRRSA